MTASPSSSSSKLTNPKSRLTKMSNTTNPTSAGGKKIVLSLSFSDRILLTKS